MSKSKAIPPKHPDMGQGIGAPKTNVAYDQAFAFLDEAQAQIVVAPCLVQLKLLF